MHALLSRLIKDRRGAPTLEFALLAPVLIAAMVGAADVAKIAFERSDMLGAARSGTQYFVAGGTDAEQARTLIADGWNAMPEDARILIDHTCECGGETAACDRLCPDGELPVSYAVIELQARVDGVFLRYTNQAHDKVRIR